LAIRLNQSEQTQVTNIVAMNKTFTSLVDEARCMGAESNLAK